MKTDDIYVKYADSLRNLQTDDSIFLTFKGDPNFTEILEHVNQDLGNKYNDLIKSEFGRKASDFMDLIQINDAIGNPKKYVFDGIEMSPSNLRYIYQSLLLQSKFAVWFKGKKQLKIVEIGGGYGGLCFYLARMLKEYDIDYTIIDLPDPSYLQKKYLAYVGQRNFRTVSCFDIDQLSAEKFDLVISNYCLSEIGRENQRSYFDKIVANCDKKFFIWNYITRKRILGIIKTMNIDFIDKKDYVFEEERPQTGAVNKFVYSK